MITGNSAASPGIAERTFESISAPRNDRADRWLIAAGCIWDSVSSPRDECLVKSHLWPMGRLILVHTADQGRRAPSRSLAAVRSDQLDHYRVVLQLDRELQYDADGARRVVKPGEMIFSDLTRPEKYESDRATILQMYIPRSALDELLPRSVDLHGWVPQGAAQMLLGDHIRSLVRAVPDLTADHLPSLNIATLQLLAAVISPSACTLAEARPAIERVLFRQAQRVIEALLVDPGLSIETLCGALKVSRATLYRLFEREDGVANYVKRRRLQRAHTMIRSSWKRVTMERIADDVGFKNASYFSRAFCEHFGYNPSEVSKRALHLSSFFPKTSATRPFAELIQSLR